MANVLWLQGGACSGNTMSFLDAQEPTVVELIVDFGINILCITVGLEIGHQVTIPTFSTTVFRGKPNWTFSFSRALSFKALMARVK
ncbi:MAG: hypothetical protein R2788_04325 [Saprospiraceae bacterium]